MLGRVLANQQQMGPKPPARLCERWKGDGAVRVNMESDLRTSGRLGKLARTMGWSEQRTGGALWFFYWHTQEAGIVEETPDKIVSAVVVDFDSEGEAHAFVSGMVSAKLATVSENGIVRIHGNDKHVERIERFKGNASELGKKSWEARKKKLNEIQTGSFPTGNAQEQELNAQGTLLSPSSLLLSPKENTNTDTTMRLAKPPRVPKPKEPPTEIAQIRRTFRDGYAARYSQEYHWGAKHSGQAKHLLQNWPLAVVLDLIPKFFAWQRPDIIKGGHSWGNGATSFVFRIDELYADTHTPERRDIAAAIHEGERDIGVSAYNRMAGAEVLRGLLNPNEPKALEAPHDKL